MNTFCGLVLILGCWALLEVGVFVVSYMAVDAIENLKKKEKTI